MQKLMNDLYQNITSMPPNYSPDNYYAKIIPSIIYQGLTLVNPVTLHGTVQFGRNSEVAAAQGEFCAALIYS